MKYEKPQITLSASAADAIHGPKLGGPRDSMQPGNVIHTAAAYQSDE